MEKSELNKLAKDTFKWALDHGFWPEGVSVFHQLGLVITEVAECVNADRYDRHAQVMTFDEEILMIDGSAETWQSQWNEIFEKRIKDSVEDEMADVVLRCLDLCGFLHIDLTRIADSTYKREYESFDFAENAFALMKGLSEKKIQIARRLLWAIIFVEKWFDSITTFKTHDLWWFVDKKMKYNHTRPYRNGKKY